MAFSVGNDPGLALSGWSSLQEDLLSLAGSAVVRAISSFSVRTWRPRGTNGILSHASCLIHSRLSVSIVLISCGGGIRARGSEMYGLAELL